jgi:1,4-dihydroxy-2-naphthoate polyprenyltransferase
MNYIFSLAWRYSNLVLQSTRFVPFFFCSLASILVATGLAYHDLHGWQDLNGLVLVVCLLCIGIFQGIVTHSFDNDANWEKGSDTKSVGIKSGQCQATFHNPLSYLQLFWIGLLGIVITIGFGVYLSLTYSEFTWFFLLVGLWSCISYSCKPFYFAYKPLIGNLFSAFPALVICSTGTFYLLTGTVTLHAWVCSVLQALLCVAWLMQRRLAEILTEPTSSVQSGLPAPVWNSQRRGYLFLRIVSTSCFLLSCFMSVAAIYILSSIFLISLGICFLGILLSLQTSSANTNGTKKIEKQMAFLTLLHAVTLTVAFNTL